MTDQRPSDRSDDLTPSTTTDSDGTADRIQQAPPERPGRAGRRWLLPLGAAGLVSAVVAGTALVVSTVGGDTPTSAPGVLATTASARPSDQAPQPSEHQLARANAVLARWERHVGASSYVPVGTWDSTPTEWEFQQVGRWPDSNGKDRPSFIALALRQIVSSIPLPTTPANGTITWANGTTEPTEVRPAKATLDYLLTGAARCDQCKPGTFDGVKARTLKITKATLTTMQVMTTRGPATVPAWRFQFANSPVSVLQAAIAAPAVGPAPNDPKHPVDASRIDSAELAPDGRTLIVSHLGGGCGSSGMVAHAIETDHAVGITLVRIPPRKTRKPSTPVMCVAVGIPEQTTVRLTAPLNNRAVLETVLGMAVPVK
jgi:hypothetical protein